MDRPLLELLITALVSIAASSGFWAYFGKRWTLKNATTQLLLGISHRLIVSSGMEFKNRGWITKDEYEDFVKYLYTPYSQFGGNGLAERIMADVKNLPMVGRYSDGEKMHKDSVPVKVKERHDDRS